MTRTYTQSMSRCSSRHGSSRRSSSRRRWLRGSLALPAVLAMLGMLATPALAAEPTSGYTGPTTSTQEVKPSQTTSTPKQETAPAKETTTPKKEVEPTKVTTTAPVKQTLPFTGLNLAWVVAFGLVLIAAGGSIVMVQRRWRRDDR